MLRIFFFINFIWTVFFAHSQQVCNHKHHNPQLYNKAFNTRSDSIDILNYSVNLDITDFTNQKIAGFCDVQFVSKQNNIAMLDLDLLQMTIDSITSQGQSLSYSYNDTLLSVNLPFVLNTDDTSNVVVYYNGSPQGDPSGWGGWYFQGNYAYNLGVGFDANPHNYGRVWHPCFDNFVERATYDFSILTNGGKTSYANGYIVNDQIVGIDSLVRTWRMDTPIPTYLACVAVSNYTHVYQNYISTVTTDTTPVFLIAAPADTNNMKASFVNLHDAIEAFEIGYGPYLWDKVGYHLVPFNSGAMEHATSIAYPRSTANGGLAYETLMAHELAHHWWGDLVTCRTAEDMWINEGMASYSERLFLESVYGASAYIDDIKLNHKEVLHHTHINDGGYYAISGVPHSITYGDHSYNKGADVAHTLRGYLGDSLFFVGLKSFLAANVYSDVDAVGFRDHLNTISGINVTDFFNDWIFNPGFPHFSVDSMNITDNGGTFTVDLFIKQKLKAAPNYFSNVPLDVTFKAANWQEQTESFVMSGQTGSFQFTLPFSPAITYLNRNDKISQAVTGQNVVITAVGVKDLSFPLMRITTNSIVDSAFLRVEHHWAAPDGFKDSINESRYSLSNERYWRIAGMSNLGFNAIGRVFLNGTNSTSGNLDNDLVIEPGFNEDSLRVFYRSDASSEWEVVSSYTYNTLGSNVDGYAYVNIDSLKNGEYTFGWENGLVNIVEEIVNKEFSIYPNPVQKIVNVDLSNFESDQYTIRLYNMNGELIKSKTTVASQNFIDISKLTDGQYLISVIAGGKFIGSKKLIKN